MNPTLLTARERSLYVLRGKQCFSIRKYAYAHAVVRFWLWGNNEEIKSFVRMWIGGGGGGREN